MPLCATPRPTSAGGLVATASRRSMAICRPSLASRGWSGSGRSRCPRRARRSWRHREVRWPSDRRGRCDAPIPRGISTSQVRLPCWERQDHGTVHLRPRCIPARSNGAGRSATSVASHCAGRARSWCTSWIRASCCQVALRLSDRPRSVVPEEPTVAFSRKRDRAPSARVGIRAEARSRADAVVFQQVQSSQAPIHAPHPGSSSRRNSCSVGCAVLWSIIRRSAGRHELACALR